MLTEELTVIVYPNPTETSFNVQFSENIDATVYLFNPLGKIVFVRKCEGRKHLSFDISNMSVGVYVVKTVSDNNVFTHRIVKY